MDSMCNSLTHALHSLRNPHFLGRSTARFEKKKVEEGCAENLYDLELRNRLSLLNKSVDQGFLTLPWLHSALILVIDTIRQISDVLPRITCSEKEKMLLELNLKDTLVLLDVCNGLKEALNDVQSYVMLVRYATRLAVDVKNASDEELKLKLSRLHTALVKSEDFMHSRVEENTRQREGKSKLDTCSTMLRRMGEPLPEASPNSKRAASNAALFNDLYAVKLLAIFVCSVLAITLSVKPKRRLSCVHMEGQPSWLQLLQSVQQNVKKLTDEGIDHNKITLLKELGEVRTHTNELYVMLDNFFKLESPIAEIDKLTVSQQCERLTKESDNLQRGLLVLQQHVDNLFRMLVTIRVDFLDALCHV